jgi:hypothetical protein
MLKAIITFHEKEQREPLAVVMGASEDVRAPRGLEALTKTGLVVDDAVTLLYKAYLAGQRQGDISNVGFESWADTVLDIDPRPSRKQIRESVLLGTLKQAAADGMIALLDSEEAEGESPAPPTA